ncbi:DUF1330 domain-containing protein [Alicyclobacillus ferrooxydans]|uniref:DUF1330 domain-containing protein n=1 Tax=Alicyclobacillus ferrooxydans TaxID=471514 RepID=A0A0P9CTV6_9BACL|nr:DUF1330 domain-containing protein [Alicyclobacillus ferrooxydans]KPV43096.1 hypothetical protein AN477_14285 [Alicyclobacillus ferrooxydans]
MSIYALNLFNLKSADEYRKYAREAQLGLEKHGGKVVAVGDLVSTPQGDIKPRRVMMLVEWESKKSIRAYLEDPDLAHIHQHREDGQEDFVWHLFERMEDLKPILDSASSPDNV